MTAAVRSVFILPIRLYQRVISPLMPANTCKYHPSCSEYAALAIRKHGVFRGIPMAGWRDIELTAPSRVRPHSSEARATAL